MAKSATELRKMKVEDFGFWRDLLRAWLTSCQVIIAHFNEFYIYAFVDQEKLS